MIKRILGNASTWLVAGLLGFAVYQHGVAQRNAAERDAANERVIRAELRTDALVRGIEWQRNQIEILNNVLEIRDRQLDAIAADTRASRAALASLEREDAAIHDWAHEPVPDGIHDWLLGLTGSRDASGDPGAERPGDDAQPD